MNNNEENKMIIWTSMNEIPGFEGFSSQLYENYGIEIDNRMMKTSYGNFLIVGVSSYIADETRMDPRHGMQVDVNILFAYGEKAIVRTTFQWYILENIFNNVSADYPDPGGQYWFNCDIWPMKYAKDVMQYGLTVTDYESMDEIPEWENYYSDVDSTHRHSPISWFRYLPEAIHNDVKNRIENN